MNRKTCRKMNLLLAASTASLVASIMNAGAQTTVTNAPVKMGEVIVTATNAPSLTVPDVYRAQDEISRVPGGVDVIAASEYLTGRASTMKDMLDYSPGVFVQSRFGAEEARLSIRGSGIQRTFHGRGIKVLQDGVPLNLADGSFDMQAIEPLAVDYLEVLRGGNALRYGSTTLGGAINYLSPTGHEADKIRLRLEAGSYGYIRGLASSGLAEGNSDYYASVSHYSQDGFRDHARQNTQRVFANVGHKLSENLESRLYFTYVNTFSELPGSLTKAQLETNPEQANAGNIALNQQRNFELIRVANKTSWRRDDQQVDFGVFWSHKDLAHPINTFVDQNSNDVGLDLRYRNRADFLGRPNQLTVGFSPTFGILEDNRFANTIANPGARGAFISEATQTAYNLDLYIENQHWLSEQWSVLAGVQLSQAHRELDTTAGAVAPDFSFDYWSANPKVGVIYDFKSDWQFYANVSRSAEPPSFSELGLLGTGVAHRDAQSAWTIELGTRGERGWLAWDATYYRSWVNNELLSYVIGAGPATGTINASTTIHQGVELGSTATLFTGIFEHAEEDCFNDRLLWRTAYQWNDFRFQNDPTFLNNQLPGIPAHYLRSELTYAHPCGFYFGPNVEWSPVKYAVDMTNTLFSDPYALVGIKAGYRTRKGFSAFVEVRNLTDKRYAATTGVITDARIAGANLAQFFPGDGRSFYGGLEWKW